MRCLQEVSMILNDYRNALYWIHSVSSALFLTSHSQLSSLHCYMRVYAAYLWLHRFVILAVYWYHRQPAQHEFENKIGNTFDIRRRHKTFDALRGKCTLLYSQKKIVEECNNRPNGTTVKEWLATNCKFRSNGTSIPLTAAWCFRSERHGFPILTARDSASNCTNSNIYSFL